jgi:solute carrier family 25 citrate transporter 1
VRGQHEPLGPNFNPKPKSRPNPNQVRGQHGPLGLYQGGASWLVAAGPRAAVRFGSFGALSDSAAGQALRERHGRAVSDLAAGLVSGALEAALVQTPNQAVQVKMVHDQSPQGPQRYRSLPHAVRSIHREFGFVKGFLEGMGPTVLKVPPYLVSRP